MYKTLKRFRRKARQKYYTLISRLFLGKAGEGLKVNNMCYFTKNTEVGNHCNFNGIRMVGGVKYVLAIISILVLSA